MRLIYLDYNSTTPLAGAAREAMLPFLYEFFGSPNSTHWTGAAVAEAIEDARTAVASLLNCEAHEVIFTSGGTESINLALRSGLAQLARGGDSPQLLLTTWEYTASHRLCSELHSGRTPARVLLCEARGRWRPQQIADAVGDRPTLLSLTLADGDTGAVQPIVDLLQLLRRSGQREHCVLHVDACQAVGKIDVDCESLDADLLSVSGHKMYAAKGVGALVVRNSTVTTPQMVGDWFERGLRNGMPNVAGIIGMGAAAKLVSRSVPKFAERCRRLLTLFDDSLRQCCGTSFVDSSIAPNQLPNTALLSLPEASAADVLQRAAELCVKSFGAAAGDSETQPRVARAARAAAAAAPDDETAWQPIDAVDERAYDPLRNLGWEPRRDTAMRISFGWNTTESEVIAAAEAIGEAYLQGARH